MVKLYAVSLAIGVVGLIILTFSGAFLTEDEANRSDDADRPGPGASQFVAGLAAFGMGGMAAEFAPLDIDWPLAFALAALAGVGGVLWARFATRSARGR